MARLKSLLLPFVLWIVLALRFFSVRFGGEEDLLASVLGDGLSADSVNYDIRYGMRDSDLVVESNAVLDGATSLSLMVAFDADSVSFDDTQASSVGRFDARVDRGVLTIWLSDLWSIAVGQELLRIPYHGDEDRIVLSDVSVDYTDGHVQSLSVYRARSDCLGPDCTHGKN